MTLTYSDYQSLLSRLADLESKVDSLQKQVGAFEKEAKRELKILKATYGDGPGVSGPVVTHYIASKVQGGRLYLEVSNENVGIDPLEGVLKYLEVTYMLDGVAGTVGAWEQYCGKDSGIIRINC